MALHYPAYFCALFFLLSKMVFAAQPKISIIIDDVGFKLAEGKWTRSVGVKLIPGHCLKKQMI